MPSDLLDKLHTLAGILLHPVHQSVEGVHEEMWLDAVLEQLGLESRPYEKCLLVLFSLITKVQGQCEQKAAEERENAKVEVQRLPKEDDEYARGDPRQNERTAPFPAESSKDDKQRDHDDE